MVMADPKLWKAEDVAAFLGLSTDWVYAHNNEIPHLKIGGRLRPDPKTGELVRKGGRCRYEPKSKAFQDWLALYGKNYPREVDDARAAS